MYTLTLTQSERKAIDWVGGRYAHGHDLWYVLTNCQQEPEETDWADEGEITFHVPEHVAWEISDLIEEDNLACFGSYLTSKLYAFSDAIV